MRSVSSGTKSTLGVYEGARVAVLGASGFIGRWVARLLCAHRAQVVLIVRDASTAQRVFDDYHITGETVEFDVAGSAEIRDLLQRIAPSLTFNLAGYGIDRLERDADLFYKINEKLVGALCRATAGIPDQEWRGQRIIHAGSALEYGDIRGDLSEDCEPNATTLYGKSKLAGTRALAHCCERLHVKGLTARLFTVYGPGEHETRLLPSLLAAAANGRALDLTSGAQQRDFTYVEDVAEGLLRLGLVQTTAENIVNLATGKLTSVREFAETAARLLSIPAENTRFGRTPTREEEMAHSPVAIRRLQQTIDWVPPTEIPDGIQRTIEFGREVKARGFK